MQQQSKVRSISNLYGSNFQTLESAPFNFDGHFEQQKKRQKYVVNNFIGQTLQSPQKVGVLINQMKRQGLESQYLSKNKPNYKSSSIFGSIPDKQTMASSQNLSGMQQSKSYYMKYIHTQNMQRIQKSQEFKKRFIPLNESSNQMNYEQRYKKYYKQLTIEEQQQKKHSRQYVRNDSEEEVHPMQANRPSTVDVETNRRMAEASRPITQEIGAARQAQERYVSQPKIRQKSIFGGSSSVQRKQKIKFINQSVNEDLTLTSDAKVFSETQSVSHQTHSRGDSRKKKEHKQILKNSQEIINKQAEIVKNTLLENSDHFMKLCGDNSKKTARLTKQKFRQILTHKFGINIAEKLSIMFDFNQQVNHQNFVEQIISIIKDRTLMNQIIFDVFDSNNDGQISQIDVYKLINAFNQGPCRDKFEESLYTDIVQISQKIWAYLDIKNKALEEKNDGDKMYLNRVKNFRNLQVLDPTYQKQKEKVLWPLFTFKDKVQMKQKPIMDPEILAKRLGKNPKLFNRLDSVLALKQLKPLQNGKQKLLSTQPHIEHDEAASDEDTDEEQNKDFFESMVFWQFEENRKQGTKKLQQAAEQKEMRKKNAINSQANIYETQKNNRNFADLSKIKPTLGGKYPNYVNSSLYIFKNPIFEEFFNKYMEHTQALLNEYIKFDQFCVIKWKYGIPVLMIEIMSQITEDPFLIKNYFKNIYEQLQLQTNLNIEKVQNPMERSVIQKLDEQPNYEKDEVDSQDSESFQSPQRNLEQRIKQLKGEFKSKEMWERFVSAFKILSVERKESKYLSTYKMTEKSLRDNFSKLFLYKCDILARIMYIKISKRKNCAQINIMQFWEAIMGLLDDVKDRRNRTIFELMEFNGYGQLDIMILMQLFNNVSRDTLFGQEILKMVREYKNKNVLMRGGFSRQIHLNFATFNNLVPYSSLIDEFQYRLFGIYYPEKRENQLIELKEALIKKRLDTNVKSRMATAAQISSGDSRPHSEISEREKMDLKTRLVYDRDKKLTLPPPIRSPFEEICNLEMILEREEAQELKKRKMVKKNEDSGEVTLADYMMTQQQYQKLYDPKDMKDADLMLLKLR